MFSMKSIYLFLKFLEDNLYFNSSIVILKFINTNPFLTEEFTYNYIEIYAISFIVCFIWIYFMYIED